MYIDSIFQLTENVSINSSCFSVCLSFSYSQFPFFRLKSVDGRNKEKCISKVIDKWWEKWWSVVCPFAFLLGIFFFLRLILEFFVNTMRFLFKYTHTYVNTECFFFSWPEWAMHIACRSIQMWTKCENNWWLNALSLCLFLLLLLLFSYYYFSSRQCWWLASTIANRDLMRLYACVFIVCKWSKRND